MNQERVQEILQSIEPAPVPFKLIFSGKSNKRVNGLYKPKTFEIIIHNRNFDSENQIVYTAIHEYAHHLLFIRHGSIPMPRPHTREFWVLFRELLEKAEQQGYYSSLFDTNEEFIEITQEIKKHCLAENGSLLLELGRLLVRAEVLCRTYGARFEDYVERVLGLPKKTAANAMQAHALNLDASLGWDGLSCIASLRDPDARAKAAEALAKGATPLIARQLAIPAPLEHDDPVESLIAEHKRLERSIESMTERMRRIEERLHSMGVSSEDLVL